MELKIERRGRPAKKNMENISYIPSIIKFDQIVKLNKLEIDPRALEMMKSGLPLDDLFSHEGGVACATNYMVTGDPGVGKTTILLDLMSAIQKKEGRKCLFISGEMGKKQMFKYHERFPQFGIVKTLFTSDYIEYNTKDLIEQLFDQGWDVILTDSIAEILEAVRSDNGWDAKMADKWYYEQSCKQNRGENKENKFTTFLNIQQVTKSGDFKGSTKLKHLFDCHMEIRKDKKSGDTWMEFTKNREGNIDVRYGFQIQNSSIYYGTRVEQEEDED